MKVTKNRAHINPPESLVSIDRSCPTALTAAGQWLQKRYHVAPHLADFLALQALLGGEQ
jgi:hypothetical protein